MSDQTDADQSESAPSSTVDEVTSKQDEPTSEVPDQAKEPASEEPAAALPDQAKESTDGGPASSVVDGGPASATAEGGPASATAEEGTASAAASDAGSKVLDIIATIVPVPGEQAKSTPLDAAGQKDGGSPTADKPAEAKPVEVKPVEVNPPEVKPSDVKSAEVKPAEVKVDDIKPEAKKEAPTGSQVAVKSALASGVDDKTKSGVATDKSNKPKSQVDSVKSTRASMIESIKSKLTGKKAAEEADKSVDQRAADEYKAQMTAILQLPGPNLTNDEYNFERQGFLFSRIVKASTERSCIYPAKGLTSVPVVVKVTLLEYCSPRVRDNLQKNASRIIRFVGGNGGEPPHPVFVRVYEIFQVDVKVFLFMDEVGKESLLDMIKARTNMSQEESRSGLKQICEAVQFLQKRGIAHRAIKIDHIHFDRNRRPKLIGWNRAVFFYDPTRGKMLKQKQEVKSFVNSHLPPEAFEGTYDPAQADNWSLGVLLVALHTRRYAFKPNSRVGYGAQWTAFTAKHRFSPLVLSLLQTVFLVDPSKRASIAQMLADKYWEAATADIEQPQKPPKSKMGGGESKTGGGPSVAKPALKKKSSTTASNMSKEESTRDIEGSITAADSKAAPKPGESKEFPAEEASGSDVPVESDAKAPTEED